MIEKDALVLYKPGEHQIDAFLEDVNGDLVVKFLGVPARHYHDEGYQVMTYAEAEPQAKAADLKRFVTQWQEISEDRFWDLLEILPPDKWQHFKSGSLFRMIEYTSTYTTDHVAQLGGKYYMACKEVVSSYERYWQEVSEYHRKRNG